MRPGPALRSARAAAVAALLGLSLAGRPALAQRDPAARWDALNEQYAEATRQHAYDRALAIAEEALEIARRNFAGDQRLLLSLNATATALYYQGQLGKAEPLYRETLRLMREQLGPRHPDTLNEMAVLAKVLADEGRYGEAETLQRETLDAMREALGPRSRETLTALNNLGALLLTQRRYAEAEPLLREALQARREAFGPRDRDTLESMGNMGALLLLQHRYAEAEPFYREELRIRRELFGPGGHETLVSMSSLAGLLLAERRYPESEALLREALGRARETLDPRDPLAPHILGLLGDVLQVQRRNAEAEPLLREALALARKSPGLGPAHPATWTTHFNLVIAIAAQGRVEEAANLQWELEPQVLNWLGTELHTTETPGARQNLVASQASYQDLALSLALLPGASWQATELAASAVLRFKNLAAEEEAYLAAVARRGGDARLRALAAEVAELRQRLAGRSSEAGGAPSAGGRTVTRASLAGQLDAKEQELGQASRSYGQELQVRGLNLKDLRRAIAELPVRGALLDVREYRPVQFQGAGRGEPRWAGVLVSADGSVRVRDLGAMAAGARAVQAMLQGGPGADAAAVALRAQLLGPFAAELTGVERLYVAPDGVLFLTNPAMLRGADGHRLLETMDVRLLQTGRDLLRPVPDRPTQGLAAFGGIAFGPQPVPQPAVRAPTQAPAPGTDEEAQQRRRAADALGDGFPPLPATRNEVEEIARRYRQDRAGEPVQVLEGADASKARLLALPPPRVLHLATHGFYLAPSAPSDRPMLLAGIALAGANQEVSGGGRDGLLFAIEAQGLNLEGTELVVLSACDTAQGQIDYGDGVSGLVRALRTAGARHVLVSLREVSDAGTAGFMQRFYRHLLAQGVGQDDPAAALRATQREYLAAGPAAPGGADETWTRFVLVGD